MPTFGQHLRIFRRGCSDPARGGLLTQERLGELLGLEMGDAGYSAAAVSDWERDKSKINADDRLVLAALITVLYRCGGLLIQEDADEFLRAGNYRGLNEEEGKQIFGFGTAEKAELNLDSNSTRSSVLIDKSSRQTTLSNRRQKQLILLRKVKSFWVEGVLEKTIQEGNFLTINYRHADDLIHRPWEEVVEEGHHDNKLMSGRQAVIDAFLQVEPSLLILGEPGSGKTMTLLELARDLIGRAEEDPQESIPVLLNLVSWSDQRLPLDRWVVKELTEKYQIPREKGREWLERDELTLLLDGFDETAEKDRARCADSINQFRMEQGLTGIVVCSRTAEYLEAGVRFKIGSAISVQPLTDKQIQNYFSMAGPQLSSLEAAVIQNVNLQELARSPLMLSILAQAYGQSQEDLAGALSEPEGSKQVKMTYWRRQLLETYVKSMFSRHVQQKRYAPGETMYWLSWLAQKMFDNNTSTALVEQLQPSWLRNQRWRWIYMLAIGIVTGLVGGLLVWLFFQILRESDPALPAPVSDLLSDLLLINQGYAEVLTIIGTNLLLGLAVALLQGSYFERLRLQKMEAEPNMRRYRQHLILVGVVVGSLTAAVIALISRSYSAAVWAVIEVVLFVTIARFVYGRSYLNEIRTVEALGWSWPKAAQGLGVGLILAVITEMLAAFIYGAEVSYHSAVILGLGCLILGGLRGRRVEKKSRANQGIYLSLRNSFIAAALSALVLGGVTWLIRTPTYAALTGLLVFMVAGSLFGGSNVIKHFIVRALLWIGGEVPWRFVSFLNHSARLTFLRRVGGGYIFGHRMIQLYFASLTFPNRGKGQSEVVETAGFQRAFERVMSKGGTGIGE